MPLCCCFGASRRQRKKENPAVDDGSAPRPASAKRTSVDVRESLSQNSFLSEYHDAQEHFPSGDVPGLSPPLSGVSSPRSSSPDGWTAQRKAERGEPHAHAPNSSNTEFLTVPDAAAAAAAAAAPAPASEPTLSGRPATAGPSPRTSTSGSSANPRRGSWGHPADGAGGSKPGAAHPQRPPLEPIPSAGRLVGTSDSSEEPMMAAVQGGAMAKLAACLPMLDNISMNINIRLPTLPLGGPSGAAGEAGPDAGAGDAGGGGGKRQSEPGPAAMGLLEPGCTLQRRCPTVDAREVRECWDASDATTFMVRGADYMKTKTKQPSRPPLYQLLTADVLTSPDKMTHVAQHVDINRLQQLRAALGAAQGGAGGAGAGPGAGPTSGAGAELPQLLIINVMLPMYPPSIWGSGPEHRPSQNLVYYFALPPDFDAATCDNPKAVALLQRFVAGAKAKDGTSIRDRLKLIPRVVNVEEWVPAGPLGLLNQERVRQYNDKPILTRPQQSFFSGPGYFEVDIDIHEYTYVLRQTLATNFERLGTVIFENAFVLQGDSPDELPEQVLGCVRMYRIDMVRPRRLEDYTGGRRAAAAAAAAQQAAASGA